MLRFQACGVRKTLVACSEAVDAGFKIVLDAEGSSLIHKASGEVTPIRRENGVFVMDAWVPSPGENNDEEGFVGQG